MPLYEIKRGATVIATVWPEGQQEKEIMLKDEVNISFKSPAALYFQIGDTITVYGETYYLNALDEPTKNSSLDYQYQLGFVAAYYALAKPKIFFYDLANALKVIKFEAMITAKQLLDLIVANANRTQTGWVAGDCIESVPQLLTFNGESLLTALDNGAKDFKTEWWIKNKVIHLTKKGAVSGYHFEYGYDKGLRGGLQRTNVDSSSVFSRLYVTGSDQNLPVGYRNGQPNLQLPSPLEYIQGPKYGPDEIEAVINFPDIKPERIGTISSVSSPFVFADADLDFDLNAAGTLLPGVSAKVSFLTGNLAGYNFEIAKGGYNHASRTITIVKNDVEKALELPSDLMKPQVGDTYFFFDIQMPATYVTAAENRVKDRGQEYFNEQSVPRVAYDLPPDPFYFERNDIELTIGDYVNVKDTELLLDKDIRVYSYARDLHNPYQYDNLKVSDMPIGSAYIRSIAEAEKVTKALAISQVNNIARARSNWRTTNELTTLLESVQAEMFLSRIEGGAYTTDISSTTTVNHFQTTTGNVYHEQFKENDGIWHVPAYQMDLVLNVPYYVYIKASKSSTSAEIVVSEEKITVDANPAFYHLPFGIISSIFEGNRDFTSTRGYSKLIGGLLDTGRVVSHDGTQYWDLDGNLFNIGTVLSGMNWGVTEAGTLTISGRIVATNAEFVNLAVQNLRTASTGKRIVISGEDNNQIFTTVYYPVTGDPVEYESFRLDDNIDSGQAGEPLGGIRMNTPGGDVSFGSGNGFYANGSGMRFLPGSAGIENNACLVGLLRYKNTDNLGVSSAVVGIDQSGENAYNSATTYRKNSIVTSGGTAYRYINDTPAAGITPPNSDYWRIESGISTSYAGYFIGKVMLQGTTYIKGAIVTTGGNGTGTGFTGYEYITPGNPETRKHINGVYIGQGIGMSW